MCGIVGYIDKLNPVNKELFNTMLNTLAHRGPDGWGTYYNQDKAIVLGHRRLSFIDLSDTGNQLMCDVAEKVWITFNGEIYNYKELKKELETSYQFKTDTDTEVILAAYHE